MIKLTCFFIFMMYVYGVLLKKGLLPHSKLGNPEPKIKIKM